MTTAPDFFEIRDINPELLDSERRRVIGLLRDALSFATVLEVGSTAVEGVVGKQDVDILVRAPVGRFEAARERLDRMFARNPDQLSTDDFQGYHVESPIDVAIQLTVENGRFDDFEQFLTLLATDPAVRFAYNALKRAWHGHPMDAYRAAKDDFIRRALAGDRPTLLGPRA